MRPSYYWREYSILFNLDARNTGDTGKVYKFPNEWMSTEVQAKNMELGYDWSEKGGGYCFDKLPTSYSARGHFDMFCNVKGQNGTTGNRNPALDGKVRISQRLDKRVYLILNCELPNKVLHHKRKKNFVIGNINP